MADLSTTYMGLTLKNPLIIGSSGFTSTAESVINLAEKGAGAVVLKSLYEEEILSQTSAMESQSGMDSNYASSHDYIQYYLKQDNMSRYLDTIQQSKKAVDIPVIASINCLHSGEWIDYAKTIQRAGADALELNMFIMPSDDRYTGTEIEKRYFEIVRQIKKNLDIPLTLKVSSYFSGMANMLLALSREVDGLVLFNRFYSPDIDIENMAMMSSDIFSAPREVTLPLRWIGLLSGRAEADLVASGGIHDGAAMIKALLSGATAVQSVSTLYLNGVEKITEMVKDLEEWMNKKGFASIADFRGEMSQKKLEDPMIYERAQFMKHFSSHE